MSTTYQEAWGLFHAEQDPKPQATSQRLTSFSLHNSVDDISQSSSPGYLVPSINYLDPRDVEASPQASSLDMVKELQKLRQDLHQLQFPSSSGSEHNEASHVRSSAGSLGNPSPNGGARTPGDAPQQRPAQASNGRFQCWDSCCNGRQFSNKSNFIRHQRERRGESYKLRCSFCDAVFSRSSARNAHEASRRCRKQ
ncbi:hypothetical protein MferCBS49748_002330 [Microsporum ferrugineum]